jgi:integrase
MTYPHKFKHGKQNEEMPKATFYKIVEQGHFTKHWHKALVVLLWYTGSRISELLELRKQHFTIKDNILYVTVKAKKHGTPRNPFQLHMKLPYVNLIAERTKNVRGNRKVFPITRQTAWRIIKRVAPKKYPHYFRLNRTVKFLNNPDVTMNEIRQWMAWKSIKTVDHYLGYSDRTMQKLSEKLE